MSDDYEISDPYTIGGATGLYTVRSPYNTECEWSIISVTGLGSLASAATFAVGSKNPAQPTLAGTGADSFGKMPGIDWVIVGGESGAGARPCNVGWIGDVVMQCQAAGVPCFVKQFGASVIAHPNNDAWPVPSTWETRDGTTYFIPKHPKGGDPAEWPEDLRVRQFPAL